MKIIRQEFEEASIIPWYLGHSYSDFMRDIEVFHVVPFNWVIKWWRMLESKWHWLRLMRYKIDRTSLLKQIRVRDIVRKRGYDKGWKMGNHIGYEQGYSLGYNACRAEMEERLMEYIRDKKNKEDIAFVKANLRIGLN